MRTTLCALLLSLSVPAQRLPDPVDATLEIQIHDARAVVDALANHRHGDGDPARHRSGSARALTEFLRAVVRPRLEEVEHLQSLGTDLLVFRGSPQQQVSLQRTMRELARPADDQMRVACDLVSVPQAVFTEQIVPLLGWTEAPQGGGATVGQVILDAATARLLRSEISTVEAPTLLAASRMALSPLERGADSTTKTIYYRRDYEVEVFPTKVVVWPITGKLEDGLVMNVTSAPVAGDTIGVVIDGTFTTVDKPIKSFETSLAGHHDKIVVDLPSWTTRHLNGGFRLGPDDLGVLVTGTAGDAERVLLLVRAKRG